MGSWDIDGFKIVVRNREDLRHIPHVHVFKAESSAMIAIGDAAQRPWVQEKAMRDKDLARALEAVASIQEVVLAEWRRIHGG